MVYGNMTKLVLWTLSFMFQEIRVTRQHFSGKFTSIAALIAAAFIGQASAATLPGSKPIVTAPVAAVPELNQDILMPRSPAGGNPAIATINGESLSKAHFLNSLLRVNGVPLLEKWIQLTVLKQACKKAGLDVGQAQIDAAEQGVLDQLAEQHIPAKDRIPVLEKLLARKGQSLADFRMALARTTYMLALAKGHVHVTDAQVKQAFKANFGPKVEVRDIVVNSFGDAATVHHLIMTKRVNPAVVAQKYSMDRQTAAKGGLEIIPLEDSALPQVLLSTVSVLKPDELSAAVPLNGSLHLFWLVKKIPASDVKFSKVQAALKADLLKQMKLQWGQLELNRLVAQSKITIDNPILNSEFAAIRDAYREEAQTLANEKKSATTAPATMPQGAVGK